MTKLSRRSILAGLAASPLIVGAAELDGERGVASTAGSSRKLHLYLHGATILDLQPTGIVFHAPKVVTASGQLAHAYRIGYGKKGEGDEIHAGMSIALLGFNGANKPPAPIMTNTPCLGPRKLDTSGNFCGLITPFPTNLTACREIPKNASCGDFFPDVPELKNLHSLPTVLKAEFDLQPNDLVHLVGSQWIDDGSTSPLIVHLRAEPGKPAYADHDAFPALSVELGTSIKLAAGYSKAAAPYQDPEERTLLEVEQNSTGGGITVPPCSQFPLKDQSYSFASRPANCVSLVVNNTGQPLI